MKVWNYVFLSTFLALILEFSGIPVATNLLNYIGYSSDGLNLKTGAMYLAIFGGGGILIGLGTAIVIGTLTRSTAENYVILPFIIAGTTLFLSTFIGVIIAAQSFGWIFYLILVIMGSLSVGFVYALVEHFRGTD